MAAIPEKIGKYVVSDEVARGGMGVVYKAVHPSLKRDVVIKKMSGRGSAEARERFKREAQILLDMQNPYIVHLFDYFTEGSYRYMVEEFVDGIQIADMLGLPHEKVYKTLVTQGNSKNYYVFVIPIAEELDMKKAAKAVGEKSVAMLHVKDINAVTGYIRGGCTAIGMKKQYVTRIEEEAKNLEKIIVSGGKLGTQLELTPDDLLRASNAEYADITVKS